MISIGYKKTAPDFLRESWGKYRRKSRACNKQPFEIIAFNLVEAAGIESALPKIDNNLVFLAFPLISRGWNDFKRHQNLQWFQSLHLLQKI
jgi:hypothetical protein